MAETPTSAQILPTIPQSRIQPDDLYVYGGALLALVVLAALVIVRKRWHALIWAWVALTLLLLGWIALVVATGFNDNACGFSSTYNSCQNPNHLLTMRAALVCGDALASVLCYRIVRRWWFALQ